MGMAGALPHPPELGEGEVRKALTTHSQLCLSPGFWMFMVSMSLRDASQHACEFSPVMSSHLCSMTE